MADGTTGKYVAHCDACGCKMDVSALAPYTNVVCPDCGQHSRVKAEFGQYLLTGRHAAGGMSMVFAARDVTLEREVAIKVLNETYSGDEQRMRQFEQEAKITAAISHPHVVRVFTVGQGYGHYYIAMEMVSGESLEERISREGALGEELVLPMVGEMIAGLRAAKEAGLIHRDIKPGNILFNSRGHVKIVDFGLALVTQGGTARAEEIWATPYYVPPEALEGLEEDFRSDIYALGATLYHVLSGKPPIDAQDKSTRVVRKAKEGVLPLEKVAPWLSAETCYLVNKAMALSPRDRFESYADMEESWQRACHVMEGGEVSEPIRSQDRAQRRVKGKQGMGGLVIAGVVAVALVAGAVWMKFQNNGGDDGDGEVIPPVGVNPDNGDDEGEDPLVAARIAGLVARAHDHLGKREYDEARDLFFQLMNDGQVGEPTASWAGMEAVVATLLEGNAGDASVAANKVKRHMDSKNLDSEMQVRKLGDALSGLGAIREVKVDARSGAVGVVHLMAAALKNWEVGEWQLAVPLFKRVAEHPLPDGSPLLVYREIAGSYLSDYESLKDYADLALPDTIESSQAALAELAKVLKSLETRGRAKFHVRVWQLRLHRHVRKLRVLAEAEGDDVAQAPKFASLKPKLRELFGAAKFAQASELLQDVSLEDFEKAECDSWIYLADSASAFLGTLEGGIPQAGAAVKVETVKGIAYSRVIAAKPGGLDLQGEGGKVFVAWGELKPESVLAVHQKVFRQTLKTLEGQLRTEQAVCYAWLMGIREKAKVAARKLAVANPGFQKRWHAAMRAQHYEP